jgi:hypothetical protein
MYEYQWTGGNREQSNSSGKLLTPFQRQLLQKKIQENCPESYRQRIQIMLLVDEGKTQTEICEILGCCPATARRWIQIASKGLAHQWQDYPIGRPKSVNEEYLKRLTELVISSPQHYGYPFRRWTASYLRKHLTEEFGFEISDRHFKRLLKQIGLSTRPESGHHEQNSLKSHKKVKILISDIKKAHTDEYSEIISINTTKLAKDSDIYGAQRIVSISISAKSQPYSGVFTDTRRILSLSSQASTYQA